MNDCVCIKKDTSYWRESLIFPNRRESREIRILDLFLDKKWFQNKHLGEDEKLSGGSKEGSCLVRNFVGELKNSTYKLIIKVVNT